MAKSRNRGAVKPDVIKKITAKEENKQIIESLNKNSEEMTIEKEIENTNIMSSQVEVEEVKEIKRQSKGKCCVCGQDCFDIDGIVKCVNKACYRSEV